MATPVDEHPALVRLRRDVTLEQGAKQGAAWLAATRIAAQAFQFGISIITARLLLPTQFGEAALTLSITAFAQLFTDLGLTAAVVQAKKVTEQLLSTAFFLNLLTGVLLCAVITAASLPLASLLSQPSLVGLLVLASSNFVLSFGAVPTALLERTFNFRTLSMYEAGTNIVGFASIPLLAVAGAGAYSLVIGPVLTTTLLSVMVTARVRWRPSARPTRSATRELWRFSRGLVGFNALNYWSRNLDNLLLGSVVGTAALGAYARAYSLMGLPVNQMSMVVGRVLFPSLARMQDDPRRLGRAWGRGMQAGSSVMMPIAVIFATTAPALVPVLYGNRWLAMVPLLELLAMAAVPQIVSASAGSAFRAAGQTDLLFKLGLISSLMSVVAIVIGLHWGARGVATGLLIKSWIAVPLTVVPMSRFLHLGLGELMRPVLGVGWPSLCVAAGALAVRWLAPTGWSAAQTLAVQLVAAVAGFVAAMWFTQRPLLLRAWTTATARLRPSAAPEEARSGP